MARFENFVLSEFIASDTAKKNGIDNTPDFDEVEHLEELVDTILQPIRTAYGKPLRITSGFRCPDLNKAVGGSSTSAHIYGYAADVQPTSGKVEDLYNFANKWMKDNGVMFDQSIIEKSSKSAWWHIAVRNGGGEQRCSVMKIDV